MLFGAEAAATNIAAALRDLGATRPLLVGGGHAAGVVDQICEQFAVAGHIREVVQHAPADRVRDAVALAQDVDADLMDRAGARHCAGGS